MHHDYLAECHGCYYLELKLPSDTIEDDQYNNVWLLYYSRTAIIKGATFNKVNTGICTSASNHINTFFNEDTLGQS